MFQQILVGIIFLGALGFLLNLVIRSFRSGSGCASGCGKCGYDTARVEASQTTPRP